MLMTNILSDNEFSLDAFNPYAIAREMAGRLKKRRLALKLTQQALASKSEVSLGSLKRFEHQYEISLKHLLQLAVVLDATEEFSALFPVSKFSSIAEVLKAANDKQPKRGSRNA
jgi:transcriptional regulator with XRE-family HTH domain